MVRGLAAGLDGPRRRRSEAHRSVHASPKMTAVLGGRRAGPHRGRGVSSIQLLGPIDAVIAVTAKRRLLTTDLDDSRVVTATAAFLLSMALRFSSRRAMPALLVGALTSPLTSMISLLGAVTGLRALARLGVLTGPRALTGPRTLALRRSPSGITPAALATAASLAPSLISQA